MDKKKLVHDIDRLIKLRIEKQFSRMKEEFRREVISEVSSILNYSEKKLLAKLNEVTAQRKPVNTDRGDDLDRKMSRLSETLSKRPRTKKSYVSDPTLNDILNNTVPLKSDRTTYFQEPASFDYAEMPSAGSSQLISENEVQLGMDGKPVDTSNEAVQSVLDVINNTNFKEKFEQQEESVKAFRERVGG